MTKPLIVPIAAMMLNCGIAGAQSTDMESANFYMPHCRDFAYGNTIKSDEFLRGMCLGLIAGIGYRPHNAFCVPKGATNRQAVSVVVQFIDQRPARMHENFLDLAVEALGTAWPCNK